MPPLHRMPVFYLVVLTAAAVAGVGAWARSARAPASATIPDGTPAALNPPVPVPAVLAPEPPPADGILRTADGLRRKVVVKDLDVGCRDRPLGGQPVGPPLDYFAIRYLYGEAPTKDPSAFQVGPREGPAQGWVAATAVLEWDTRLMARPTPRAGRPGLVIYREENCLLDVLAGRVCRRHRGGCPTEGEEGAPAGADSGRAPALGMPILRSRAIPMPDGGARTIFEVASLVRDQAPPPPPPTEPPPDLLPALRRVDVAFVIDTTASMQSAIDSARTLATRLVAEASQRYRNVTLRLALVEYRDDSKVFGFKTRVVAPFSNPVGFRAALDRTSAAKRGDGTVDESVFDGVAAALTLDWPTGRAGDLATKMLVLLGDAPDHARDLTRAEALSEQANQAKITIAAIALDRPGQLLTDEKARFQDQWRTLAAGSYRPLDKASGFARPVPATLLTLQEADQLVSRLQSLIDDRVQHALELAALAAAEAEGKLREYVNQQGLTLDQVAPVLVDLHKGDSAPQARPDPQVNGRRAPSVRRGWIAEQRAGKPLVTVAVLMARDELDVLVSELSQLQQAAQGSARDLSDLLRIGTAAASGETGFLTVDRGAQTFAEHLRRRQGLPPARPDSLLGRTQADLLQADDLYRSALDARLGASLAGLVQLRNSPDWSVPGRTIEGMMLVPYSLIDF